MQRRPVYDEIILNLRWGRTPFFNLNRKDNEKVKIKKKLEQFNVFLNTYGLSFKQIEISNFDNQNDFALNITENLIQNNNAAICQTARDEALMSERAYNKFRKKIKPLAKLSSLTKCNRYKRLMSSYWPIQNTSCGAFVSDPVQKIKFVCEKYLSYNPGALADNCFKILLCGDGFQLTRTHLNILNFSFRLLNDSDLSLDGCYVLGVYKMQNENHDFFKKALKELIEKLRKIREIELSSIKYQIKFFLGGDLKFLSAINAIKGANSKYPCIWCVWENKILQEDPSIKVEDLAIFKEIWKINGRSHAEARNKSKENNDIDLKQGYSGESILDFINFEENIVDVLHLFLRISDKLFDALHYRLDMLDGHPEATDLSKRPLLKILHDFIEIECNVTHPYYFKQKGEENPILKMRALNENERIKIFTKMFEQKIENGVIKGSSLVTLFPDYLKDNRDILRLSRLFKNFKDIINIIKQNHNRNFDKKVLEEKLKVFLYDYIKSTPDKKITPYIHILVFHISEFIQIYKNINIYSMQGLEKKNHFLKTNFFRQTNHHKNEFPTILIEKLNRTELIHLKANI